MRGDPYSDASTVAPIIERAAGPSTALGRGRRAKHNQGVENHDGRSAELHRCHLAQGDHRVTPRAPAWSRSRPIARKHLRGRRRQAHGGRRRRHDHRHRVRHLLDHQGDHRHRRAAAGRGRPARARCAGEDLCPGHRQAAGARGLRCSRAAEAAPAQARRHHPDAAAAHRGLRLRLLQRELQPPRQGARAAERAHGDQGGAQHAPSVRSRRRVGIRLQHRLGRPGGRGDHRQAARRGHGGARSSRRST